MSVNIVTETKNLLIYIFKDWAGPGSDRAFVAVKDCVKSFQNLYKNDETACIAASSFDPTFEDLHAIIQAIVDCEQKKYSNQVDDPKQMLASFLHDCVYESDFFELDKHYGITSKGRKAQHKEHSPWIPRPFWVDTKTTIHPKKDSQGTGE